MPKPTYFEYRLNEPRKKEHNVRARTQMVV